LSHKTSTSEGAADCESGRIPLSHKTSESEVVWENNGKSAVALVRLSHDLSHSKEGPYRISCSDMARSGVQVPAPFDASGCNRASCSWNAVGAPQSAASAFMEAIEVNRAASKRLKIERRLRPHVFNDFEEFVTEWDAMPSPREDETFVIEASALPFGHSLQQRPYLSSFQQRETELNWASTNYDALEACLQAVESNSTKRVTTHWSRASVDAYAFTTSCTKREPSR